ncbi:MAG: alpha/beta fold hydrolase [Sphingobacteriales bacterium]|nr:MAG: alpha/beta fold hydrolase [Sphingobacteriales bacterium]
MRIILRLFFMTVGLFSVFESFSIKPKTTYEQRPEQMNVNYKTNKIKVDSATTLNSWYLQPVINRKNVTVIISNGDYGNMGNFILNGVTLYDLGYDVVMYDYRGFGGSSEFATDTNLLFHQEYVADLRAVHDYYKKQNPGRQYVLMGLSMGTIVSTIYIGTDSLESQLFVYDGFVNSIDHAVNTINRSKHKSIKAPIDDSVYEQYVTMLTPGKGLIFNGSKDHICRLKASVQESFEVVNYEGSHLQGFYKLSENGITGSLYNKYINEFISKH